jgi:hypothetical protein
MGDRTMKRTSLIASAVLVTLATGSLASAATLTALSSFAGDGWLAPGEGGATWLDTTNNTRGMAYNPTTGNVIVVSRQGGNNIRIVNGTSGVPTGTLNLGSGVISGGTFAINMVGVADDGTIYVSNLAANTNANGMKIYRWANESATPTTFVDSTTVTSISGITPRLGDSLDVIGSGSATRIVAGFAVGSGTPPAGSLNGYAIYDDTGALTVVNPITGTNNGDFRLGITFGPTANNVWGKQTSNPVRLTSYSGSNGTLNSSFTTVNGSAMAMDYTSINGTPYLAVLDATSSVVRVYDMTNPLAPSTVAGPFTTTSGILAGNTNATGSIKWGAITQVDPYTWQGVIYAMSTNQGVQAMVFTIPEPTVLGAVAGLGLVALRRRKA